jgi:transcription elongation GreA/GreB family factor
MRYEAKTEEEAVAGAARALGKAASELKYTVIRDEKAFWGGRVVEIEVEAPGAVSREPEAEPGESAASATAPTPAPPVLEVDAVAAVEATLTELL